jgi:hypothetical protein
MFEHLAQVSTINPAIAVWAENEMLGLVFRLFAHALPDNFAALNRHVANINAARSAGSPVFAAT